MIAEPTEIPATLFGRNEFNPDTKVVAIGAGIGQWSAITDRGDLYVWGRNRCGSLGLGHLKDQFFPIKVAFLVRDSCCLIFILFSISDVVSIF